MTTHPPRFLADANVGRLARWLRLLGYDVEYARHLDDRQLARRSRQEGRILLTTDRKLAQEQKLESILLLESFEPWEQLRQFLSAYPSDPAFQQPFTRCSRCNAPLEEVAKEGLEGQVPPKSYAFYERFARCTGCGRLYWPGTHVDRILKRLERLRKDSGSES